MILVLMVYDKIYNFEVSNIPVAIKKIEDVKSKCVDKQ